MERNTRSKYSSRTLNIRISTHETKIEHVHCKKHFLILLKVSTNSHSTCKKELHSIQWLHPSCPQDPEVSHSVWYSCQVIETSQLRDNDLHGISQLTLHLQTQISVALHILRTKLHYLTHVCRVRSKNVQI
jgi:hypothetical protein